MNEEGAALIQKILDLREKDYNSGSYGLFDIVLPSSYVPILGSLYGPHYGVTVEDRIKQIAGLRHIIINRTATEVSTKPIDTTSVPDAWGKITVPDKAIITVVKIHEVFTKTGVALESAQAFAMARDTLGEEKFISLIKEVKQLGTLVGVQWAQQETPEPATPAEATKRLDPCPFCGGSAIIENTHTGLTVRCMGCGVVKTIRSNSLQQVITEWNNRQTKVQK